MPDLVGFLTAAFPNGSWPSPFHILEGLQKLKAGAELKDAAKEVGTSQHILKKLSENAEPEYDLIGLRPSDLSEDDLKRAATILGGLVLGRRRQPLRISTARRWARRLISSWWTCARAAATPTIGCSMGGAAVFSD